MTLALSPALAERPDPTRRFLRAALALATPSVEAVAAAGVPHRGATEFVCRLQLAGEIDASGWMAEARESYRALLDSPTGRVERALGRLPASGRPREKAFRDGIESLSDAELVALILRTGPAEEGVLEFAARLLREHDGLVGLARRDVEELARAHGLGPAKAAELASAFELARRLARAELRERPKLATPEAVAELLAPLAASLPHEELWCLPLDAQSRLIGQPRVVSKGDVDGTDAGPRAFFRLALVAGASSCIAVHNHPGGDPTPSGPDRAATARLVAAGKALDLALVDHIVVGAAGNYCSIRRLFPDCFR
jgi:DNA repair protein RadC